MDPDLVKVVNQGERLTPTDYAEALAKRSVLWETTRARRRTGIVE